MTYGWIQKPTLLARKHVRLHLEGRIIIAPRFPKRIDFFEVDLDAKDDTSRATLFDRLYAVVAALDFRSRPRPLGRIGRLNQWSPDELLFKSVPGIIWRTSKGPYGGLRYRVVLDRDYDRNELGDRVREKLARAGIVEKGGVVEVFPDGVRGCRAALGRESMLFDLNGESLVDIDLPVTDPGCCTPVGHRFRGHRIVRDVPAYIRVWARLVEERRLPLESILGAEHTGPAPCPTLHVKKVWEMADAGVPARRRSSPQADASVWSVHIAELEADGAPEGGRFDAIRDLTFHWCVGCGKSDDEIAELFEDWLDHAPHGSKDLTGPDASDVRATALRSLPIRLEQLRADLASRRIHAGRGASSVDGVTAPLLSLRRERNTHGAGWREVLRASLEPHHAALLRPEADARLHRALGVLLAAVLRARTENPGAATIAVPRGVLQSIMGGGSRTFRDADGHVIAPYRALLQRALELGVLGRLVSPGSKADRRASIFGLPSRVAGELSYRPSPGVRTGEVAP